MDSDIKRHGPSEQVHVEKKQERRADQDDPGRTPGSSEEGGIDKDPSKQRPGPIEEPRRTPGRSEG